MRLLTTNGMDVKGMKGYTNSSKQNVLRYPSEFGRVYQYCQIFYGHPSQAVRDLGGRQAGSYQTLIISGSVFVLIGKSSFDIPTF
jgi:hypothetical protein